MANSLRFSRFKTVSLFKHWPHKGGLKPILIEWGFLAKTKIRVKKISEKAHLALKTTPVFSAGLRGASPKLVKENRNKYNLWKSYPIKLDKPVLKVLAFFEV
jgi:hypothetical protein